jgi:hypothetical protein
MLGSSRKNMEGSRMTTNNRQRSRCFAIAIAVSMGGSFSAEAQDDFQYRCVIVDTPTAADQRTSLATGITESLIGSTFHVEYWATDSGVTNSGIVSAYLDLGYPANLVSCGNVTNSGTFNLFPSGTCSGAVVDELGGSQLNSGVAVEPQWLRIASVEFMADAAGSAEFVFSPAVSESSAFNRGLILPSNIQYGSCSVVLGTLGACCHFDGTCTNGVFEAACLSGIGYAWHDGMSCSQVTCVVVPAASSWGLAVLALLVLSFGSVILLRNSSAKCGI